MVYSDVLNKLLIRDESLIGNLESFHIISSEIIAKKINDTRKFGGLPLAYGLDDENLSNLSFVGNLTNGKVFLGPVWINDETFEINVATSLGKTLVSRLNDDFILRNRLESFEKQKIQRFGAVNDISYLDQLPRYFKASTTIETIKALLIN